MAAANQTRIPNSLIAFAYVEEDYAKSGDIVRGLMPLFAPILAKNPFRRFDPQEFAQAVEERYDIPMSPLVAESLVPQLVSAGLLDADADNPNVYRIAKNNYVFPEREESALESLLTEFVDFARPKLKQLDLEVEDSEVRNGLIRRLTDLNFLSFLERPDKNYFRGRRLGLNADTPVEEHSVDSEQALDILSAEFALQMSETDAVKFDQLSSLGKGALIAEVVLTLQTPSSDSDLSGVTVLIDGPLILDVLDLSTPELSDYAKALFNLIDRARTTKGSFLHTVNEMTGTIRAPLDALQRGERLFGPLGSRIRHDQSHAAYARAILTNMAGELSKLHIEIIDAGDYEGPTFGQYCPDDVEDSLRNDFGLEPDTFERRQRDAHSVATVMRMRQAKSNPKSIPKSRYVMVTRNAHVADRSRRVLITKRLLDITDFPPLLTDRQLAGLLWFMVGGNIGALSRTKLIANCSAALHPRTDIASKLSQYLYEADTGKVEIFTALMRDERAQRCLMRETLGFPAAITRDNAEALLESMRRATAEEVRREARAREEALRAQHEEAITTIVTDRAQEVAALTTNLLSEASQRSHDELEHSRRIEEGNSKIAALSADLSDARRKLADDVDARVQLAVNSANMMCRILQAVIVVLYGSLAAFPVWFQQRYELPAWYQQQYGFVLTALVAVLGFWFIPKVLFDRPIRSLWLVFLRWRLRRLRVSSHVDEFEIDQVAGAMRRVK